MSDDPEELAIRALNFVAADPSQLARFLDATGWSPQALAEADSRSALLLTVLDYLMQNEDLLMTFAANAGVMPESVGRSYQALSGDTGMQGS